MLKKIGDFFSKNLKTVALHHEQREYFNFHGLPDDLQILILEKLPLLDLGKIPFICKKWRNHTASQSLLPRIHAYRLAKKIFKQLLNHTTVLEWLNRKDSFISMNNMYEIHLISTTNQTDLKQPIISKINSDADCNQNCLGHLKIGRVKTSLMGISITSILDIDFNVHFVKKSLRPSSVIQSIELEKRTQDLYQNAIQEAASTIELTFKIYSLSKKVANPEIIYS